MGKIKSEKERKLQRKLIPLNIIVCIIALVAAISLFLTPFIKVDAGKILRDDGIISFADDKIDGIIGDEIEGTEQQDIDYKPVVSMIVKSVLGKAEGEISVSALSAFRVLTGSGDKTQMVMDDLLFGENALATKLIDSVVKAVADIFETEEGKTLLEETVVSAITKGVVNNVEDEKISDALTDENVKEIVVILRELSDAEKVPDGKVDAVAGNLIDKFDAMLGEDVTFDEEARQDITSKIQDIYDGTVEHLKEGETVSMESIICVNLSKNVDLSTLNLEDLLNGVLGDGNGESGVHISTIEGEIEGTEPDTGDGETPEGGETGGEQEGNLIVSNYPDLLLAIGYDDETKDDLKEKMRSSLNAELNRIIEENGIDEYMGYYEYIFYGMLVFIVPWLILFLFSFFHLLAKNKRFTMWYVKLICWIPPLIWLVLTLFPVLAPKLASLIPFINDLWYGENAAIVQAIIRGIGSYTWICGLCYVLLWLVSILWAFPIKHKIRKERKNPEVVDADDEEEDY